MLLLKLFYCVIWQLQPCMNHQNLVFKKITWKLKMFLKCFAVTAWIKSLKSHRHMFLSIISVLSLKNSFIYIFWIFMNHVRTRYLTSTSVRMLHKLITHLNNPDSHFAVSVVILDDISFNSDAFSNFK